jgi:uncharacterized membrane protein
LSIPFIKKKDFFTPAEQNQIVEAIKLAEKQTSGEIRVFVESKCRFVHPLDRAVEVFRHLKMNQTAQRNGVLVYVAIKDRQLAIFGDQGIHEKVGEKFWQEKVALMIAGFSKKSYAESIARIVSEIGEALRLHFPYADKGATNELPDDIVFGR